MNDTTETGLVEELAAAMGLIFGPGDIPPGPDEVAACLPIIIRLLTTRAVPEPDADAVDGAYRERNQVVAALSKCFYSWIGNVDDAEPGWSQAVYIDLPTGQVSWHVSDDEMRELFSHLQVSGEPWDGHTTDEKYERLAALQPAAAHGDADWLDLELDSVHPLATLHIEPADRDDWKASVPHPGWGYMVYEATRREAILDAVAKARKKATDAN